MPQCIIQNSVNKGQQGSSVAWCSEGKKGALTFYMPTVRGSLNKHSTANMKKLTVPYVLCSEVQNGPLSLFPKHSIPTI